MIKLKLLLSEINIVSRLPLENELSTILKRKEVDNKYIIDWFKNNYVKWFISPDDDIDKKILH